MFSIDMEKIFSEPILWIHSSWINVPDCCHYGASRGILNKILANQFGIDKIRSSNKDYHSEMVLIYWGILCEVLFYMACQRYRKQLLYEPLMLTHKKARSFMCIDIMPDATCELIIKSIKQPLQLAWTEALSLSHILPEVLFKNIRWLFPQDMDESPLYTIDKFDFLLFQLATQHARNYLD